LCGVSEEEDSISWCGVSKGEDTGKKLKLWNFDTLISTHFCTSNVLSTQHTIKMHTTPHRTHTLASNVILIFDARRRHGGAENKWSKHFSPTKFAQITQKY